MRAHSHAKANGPGPLANGFIMPSFRIKTPPLSDASRDGSFSQCVLRDTTTGQA